MRSCFSRRRTVVLAAGASQRVHADPALFPSNTHFDGLSMGFQTIGRQSRIRDHSHGDRSSFRSLSGPRPRRGGGDRPSAGAGHSCFLGYDVKHEIINESDDELIMLWVISPPGPEHFFREIGRPRVAGEEAPPPFQRPTDVVAIERKLGMNDTVA